MSESSSTEFGVARSPEARAVELARELVAAVYAAIDRADLSRIVGEGHGDDFPEVRKAASVLRHYAQGMAHYRTALVQYAEPAFWDDSLPGGALAFHDKGEMATNVLKGKPAFSHRD